jgi:L-iditol 2-dehydrogenase
MRAAVAGDPGEVKIVEMPELILGSGDVLIAPKACGICSTDVKFVNKGSTNHNYSLGHEVAGEILAVSDNSDWVIGQRVVAMPYLPCDVCFFCHKGQHTLCERLYQSYLIPGGLAENIKAPRALAERGLFQIPEILNNEIAALAEPVGCAIKGIEDSRVSIGDAVLVIGDGPMGLLCAAISRAYGAYPVMIAGMTSHRLAIAKENFADIVIDVTTENMADLVSQHTSQRGADVVIAAVSSGLVFENAIQAVRSGGIVNAFAGVPDGTLIELDIRKLHYKQYYLTGSSGISPIHMQKALQLLSSGRINMEPIITKRFAFSQTSEAINYSATQIGLKAMVTFP